MTVLSPYCLGVPHTIRAATLADRAQVQAIAIDTGLFAAEDWPDIEAIMSSSVLGDLEDHVWVVLADGAEVVGAAYYAPEPFSYRMWNLYFLGVSPGHQGSGIGAALVAHVEGAVRAQDGRVLIIETSSDDSFASTRQFYAALGYDEEARIREFYAPGDHKVVFWKALISLAS